MAYPSKLVDRAEIRTWIQEGRTYKWMSEEYLRKYNIEITPTAFSNFRAEQGMPYRYGYEERARLKPWKVRPEHRGKGADVHLTYLARMLAGKPVPADREKSTRHFWEDMKERNLVLSYSPDLGFFAVPRREGIDGPYIREPDREGEGEGEEGWPDLGLTSSIGRDVGPKGPIGS